MTDSAHWYDWAGGKRHTVITKTGVNKGLPRPTTVKDARPNNWVPSFSGVWGILASRQLEKWRLNHAFLACAETKRDHLEGDQAWMDRARALYIENTTKARDIGTKIHGEIETALTDTVWIPTPEAHAAIKALDEWCGLSGIKVEKSFAHRLGYGGQVDVHRCGYVVDFKTKEFSETERPKAWDNHAAQLAAYREGLGMPNARCAIIYVSTSVPGLTHTVEIPEDDLAHGWNLFVDCLRLWQKKNRYWPVFEEELA